MTDLLTGGYLTGLPVADPHPYDAVVDGYGVMTGDPDKGLKHRDITGAEPDNLASVAPTDYSYGALNPKFGAITSYGPMPLGMGQRFQKEIGDPRYYYTINANLSCGLWQNGGEMVDLSPAGKENAAVEFTFEIGAFFCWLNGRYAYTMDSGGVVTQRHDFGAGKAATDVKVVWVNSGSQSYAYVAMGDGTKIWRTGDGITYTQHATLEAISFEVVVDKLYRAHDRNKISSCELAADPWTAANWSAANEFYIGERTYPIVQLALQGGVLVVIKQDQPWVFDIENLARPLAPHLSFLPGADNGKQVGAYINDLIVAYGQSLFKISPDLAIDPIGTEELVQNESPVKGRSTCFAGHERFYMYSGLYNDDTGYSYLMQYGGWIDTEKGPERVDVWHGSLSLAYQKRMTTMARTAVSAPTGHLKLVIGFSDGTLTMMVLSCQANPLGCGHYRWSQAEGEVYLPTFTGKFDSDEKPLRTASVAGMNLSPDNAVELDYKLSPTDVAWTEIAGGRFDAVPIKDIDFPEGTHAVLADFRVRLIPTANTDTPRVRGLGILYQLHTDLKQLFLLDVLCADGLVDREGGALQYGAKEIRSILKTARANITGVEVTFPDEETRMVKVIGWEEGLAWDRRDEGWRSAVRLTCTEVSVVENTGFYWRLEALTYGQMEAYEYDELEEF
jgi:hypothetical protein